MAMDVDIVGGTSGNKAEVAGTNQLKVISETDATNHASNIGGMRFYSENDQGLGAPNGSVVPYLLSPETDDDYRLRVSTDVLLDEEQLSTTAQNFTKHRMDATTFVPTWSAAGYTSQATTPLTTAAANSVLRSWKTFSYQGTETLALDVELSFTYASGAALASPQVIECGFGLLATSTPFDVFDGVYFRLTASGMYFVVRNNSATDNYISSLVLAPDGTGTTIWQPVSGRKYQFIIYVLERTFELWINDPVTGVVWQAADGNVPAGLGTPTASPSLQYFLRHYQATAPAVGAYATLSHINVRRGGSIIASGLGEVAARTIDSILSPGTLTTTLTNTVTTGSIVRPTAAALSNTAAPTGGTGLTGIVLETATLAIGTDGIIAAYQNPALPTTTGTTFPQARRLRIDGVRIGSSVQTAFTAGGFAKHFYIAYGSTALSLAAAADAATVKTYRRILLDLVHAYTATQAAGTLPAMVGSSYMAFKNPIYVNPGEYVALVSYHIGTAGTAGVLQHHYAFDYAWE